MEDNFAIEDCIRLDKLENLKKLLGRRSNAKLNASRDGTWTPLLHACLYGRDSIVDYLLSIGAEADYDVELFTPLMAVCNSDCHDEEKLSNCAKSLLKKCADPNAMDKYKTTPLMYACTKGHAQLVTLLLEAKCDVNKIDNESATALHMACMYNRPNIVKLLLEHGALKTIKDRRNRLPVHLAVTKGADDIVGMLDEANQAEKSGIKTEYIRKKSSFEELLTQLPCHHNENGTVGFHSDVEVLLSGMRLDHQAYRFAAQNVCFAKFLNARNDDLKEIGVPFSSHRERIINGNKRFILHPWGSGTVRDVKNNSIVGLMDIVRSLANVVKQLHVMWAAALYCNERVTPSTENEDPKVEDLFQVVIRTRRQTKSLIEELKLIQDQLKHLDKVDPAHPADLVPPIKTSKRVSFGKIVLASALCALVAWKTNLVNVFRK